MEMLGAITGLIGAGLSASANSAQQQIAWANLQFQKDQARKQQRFASAARTDAYGNKQSYDDILNEWKIALTPTQKQITQAGEQEQLLSLTEDAARNRRQKRRAEQNAIEAGKNYEQVLAKFKYDQPKSELATRDELEQLLMGTRGQAMKDNQGIVARQALRMGKGADMARIIKATDDALGQELPKLMLNAREGAKQERAQRMQQHIQETMPEMQMWQQLMAQGGGDAAMRFSNVPQELMAMQGSMAGAIQSAMQSGASGVGSAYNSLASAMGKSPDLSGLTKAFSGSGKSGSGSSGATKYSLTAKTSAKSNPDANREPAWDENIPWGTAGDYLDRMDYGDWLF